jgi:hypothetical protein
MKRITASLLVLAVATVILLPVNAAVNNRPSDRQSIADNNGPIPPIPPCVFDASSLTSNLA